MSTVTDTTETTEAVEPTQPAATPEVVEEPKLASGLTAEQEQIVEASLGEADTAAGDETDKTSAPAKTEEAVATVPETPEPAGEEEPAPPEWTDALLERAVGQFGMKISQAKEYGSPEELRRAMDFAARQIETRQPAVQEQPEQEKPAEQEPDIFAQAAALKPLDPADGWTDEYIERDNLMRGVVQQLTERQQQNTGFIDDAAQQRQDEAKQRFYDKLDGAIVASGNKELFGEGPMRDLPEGSAEIDGRLDVAFLIENVLQTHDPRRGPVPKIEELVSRAAVALHPDHFEKKTRAAIVEELKARSAQVLGTPSARPPAAIGDSASSDAEQERLLEEKYDRFRRGEPVDGQ